MPILNRFARPPRSWPIPQDPAGIGDSVRYAEERDPVGTAVHLALAMLFCASIALSTAMTSASFVLLVGYTLLRLPNLWRALVPLAASPIVWLWLGWTAWTALNAFWSADLERWRDSLGSFWCVALLPALYPLTGRWRLLLGAFVAGAVLQGLIQLGQSFGLLPIPLDMPFRPPGIGSHPGHVTTSAAMTLMLVIGVAREVRKPNGMALVAAVIAIASASLVIAAGRGAILGALCGLGTLAATMAVRFGIPWRSPWLQAAMAVALLSMGVLSWLTAVGLGPTSLSFQMHNLERRESSHASSVSKRYLWWSVSADALREHPVMGIGTGSLEKYSTANPRTAAMSVESGAPINELAARHPHSMYMLFAAEQGVIGLAWLGSVITLTLAAAWQSTAVRPLACGILAAIVVWLVSACFECLNLPLRTASMFMLLTVLVALPRGPGAGLERWREDPARE